MMRQSLARHGMHTSHSRKQLNACVCHHVLRMHTSEAAVSFEANHGSHLSLPSSLNCQVQNLYESTHEDTLWHTTI